jgi:hypothetical protein
MVNFTVTVTEELKAEMDRYPEVNWSEVIRKSIQTYTQTRQNPTPQLEFELKEAHVHWDWLLGQPRIGLHIRVTNKLTVDVLLDRITFTIGFLVSQTRDAKGGFAGQYLQFRQIPADKSTDLEFTVYPDADTLRRLTSLLESTFLLQLDLTACVKDYPNPLFKQVLGKVPIDEWRNEVNTALEYFDQHWGRQRPRQLEVPK